MWYLYLGADMIGASEDMELLNRWAAGVWNTVDCRAGLHFRSIGWVTT